MTRNLDTDFVHRRHKITEISSPKSAFYFFPAWQKLLSPLGSVIKVFIKELAHMPEKILLDSCKKQGLLCLCHAQTRQTPHSSPQLK